MTWRAKSKYIDTFKRIKYIRRFALLPIRAGDEWKWFEVCYIQKFYHYSYISNRGRWINNRFVTKKIYDEYIAICKI